MDDKLKLETNQTDDKQLDNRSSDYSEANDRITLMTDMDKCMKMLEEKGFTDQFKAEKNKKLVCLTNNKKYVPKDVKAVNFYRFEGISNPDDMSVLYAIETCDGRKGTLVDAYGLYSDENVGDFMKQVEIEKKVNHLQFLG
jgi:hypothetical protein